MNKITDEDLTLLYYGEHDNPELAAEVARSEELSRRFEALSAELQRIDELTPPERNDDYGSEVWRQIESRLTPEYVSTSSRWKTWLACLRQPRFSLAGALALAVVASLAFVLGRQAGQPVDMPAQPNGLQELTALTELNSDRVLTASVSGHLDQLNRALTQFVNMPDASSTGAEAATDMLVANRLYRKAAADQDRQQLARFLAELEPLLIELAYEAHKASPDSLDRMQREVRDSLLFRVRVMNQHLKQPHVST
jgi:hypothetical protein